MDKQTQKRINRNNRKRGGNFEKKVADYLGFEVVPYSGSNSRFGYGDVRDDHFLIECKNITPDGDKITIKMDWITKNKERADLYGKCPVLAWMPNGRADKFVIMEDNEFNAAFFGYSPYRIVDIEPKVHNTKNLILHMSDSYIKDVRNDMIVTLKFKGDYYYMFSLKKFKEMISND